MPDTRETTIRVFGVERVIRTERKTTVKALEAAHTKAVKAALESAVRKHADERHADTMGHLATANYPDPEGWGEWANGAGERRRTKDIATEEARYAALPKTRFRFPRCGWDDARKGWPPVRYTDKVPAGLVEVEPGHYTDDPAMLPAPA